MKTKLFRCLSVAATTMIMGFTSSSAFALIDAQVMVGKRWYEITPEEGDAFGADGQQIYLGAHIDPIPLVPVAAGIGINSVTIDASDYEGDWDSSSLLEAGFEIMAWVPMVPVITPYAKVNIPLYSVYALKGKTTIEGDSTTTEADAVLAGSTSGYHLNVGAKLSVVPLVSLLVEVGMGKETMKYDEYKVDGSKLDGDIDDEDFSSQTVMVGVEVGF